MLEPSSVFYMPQAQLSTWGCDYILLENERRFQVYYSGYRVHPDAFLSSQVIFAKSKPAYDDLGVPGRLEVFDLGGDRFFYWPVMRPSGFLIP